MAQQEAKMPDSIQVRMETPAYLWEGDRIQLRGIVQNKTNHEISGQIELQIIDPATNKSADGWFRNFFPNQYFNTAALTSSSTEFYVEVPYEYNHDVVCKLFVHTELGRDSVQMNIPIMHEMRPTKLHNNTIFIKQSYGNLVDIKSNRVSKEVNGMHRGDTLESRITITGLSPMIEYSIELGIPSSLNIIPNKWAVDKNNSTQPNIYRQRIKANSKGECRLALPFIVQYSGSFVQPVIILNNKEGNVLQMYQFIDQLHIE